MCRVLFDDSRVRIIMTKVTKFEILNNNYTHWKACIISYLIEENMRNHEWDKCNKTTGKSRQNKGKNNMNDQSYKYNSYFSDKYG